MKKNTILGIDVGQSRLKMALVSNGIVKKTAAAKMPEGIMNNGRPEPISMVSELIKETMKEHGIRASHAAIVLPSSNVFVKHIEMPMMSEDQLKQNLAYEFNDFIEGDPKDFVFDYIMEEGEEEEPEENYSDEEDEEEEAPAEPEKHLFLLGVASSAEYIDSMEEMLKKAGLKMYIAAPELSAYASIIRARAEELEIESNEYAFVDLGYERIQLYMFQGEDFTISRELEYGISDVASCIAEDMGVEIHMAHTYMEANYEDCQSLESVRNRFDQIAVELKRSFDFYRFSNPSSQLHDIWLTGGGSYLEPLIEEIKATLDEDIVIHTTEELLPELSADEFGGFYLKAAGIAMNQ